VHLKKKYRGIVPAVMSALKADGSADVEGQRRLTRHLVDGGVHGLFVLGSAGEYQALSARTREEIVKAVVEENAGKVPVYVGASSNSLAETKENTARCADWGADAAVVLPPGFFFYSQDELVEYFESVAEASEIPVIAYNYPRRIGNTLEPETIERISRHPNIAGMKDSSGEMGRFMGLIYAFREREDFSIFQGSELLLAPSFIFGGDGAVAALANIAPREHVRLYDAAVAGDVAGTYEMQGKINRIFQVFLAAGDLSESTNNFFLSVKIALKLLGLCDTNLAQVGREPTEQMLEDVRKILKEEDLLN